MIEGGTTLGQVCEAMIDCEHKSAPILVGGGFWAVGTAAMRAGRIDYSTARPISAETFALWTRRLRPRFGDLLLAREAPVGPIVRIPREENVAPGQRTVLIRPEQGVDPGFMFALLSSKPIQARLQERAEGSTVAHLNVSEIRDLALPALPTLDQQRDIATTLAGLNDKIESNRRQGMLIGALFAAEFLALTNGCKIRTRLDSVATFTKGVSYRSAELTSTGDTSLVTLKSVGRHGGYQPTGLKPYIGRSKPEQVLQPRELVIAQTDLTQAADVIGRVVRVPADVGAGRLVASLDLVIVRPRKPMPVEFLYGLLLEERFREHCRSRSSGTTVLHLSSDALPQYQAPAVALEEQQQFAALSRPLLDKQDALGRDPPRRAPRCAAAGAAVRSNPGTGSRNDLIQVYAFMRATAYARPHGDDGAGVRRDASTGGGPCRPTG